VIPARTDAAAGVDRDWFDRPATALAPALLCARLVHDSPEGRVGGRIVEVEAYDGEDPASHGFRGPTPRNASMFGPPGHAYVYRSYGIHWCLNLVCEDEGRAAAVLLRALRPESGLEEMRARRGVERDQLLCAGPGRLCQALAVTGEHDGLALDAAPFELRARAAAPPIAAGPRIGISVAREAPWRYAIAGSRWLSRPAPT
jgi:DNA-3-methyladenine glycosylase